MTALNAPAVESVPTEIPVSSNYTIEQKWYKEDGYVIMCWHVFQLRFSGLYMIDGTIRDVNKPEIYEHIVISEHARSGRLRILSVPTSVAKTMYAKLDRSMLLNIMPMKKDWHRWLEPLSASAHVQYHCQECEELCRTHNRYG